MAAPRPVNVLVNVQEDVLADVRSTSRGRSQRPFRGHPGDFFLLAGRLESILDFNSWRKIANVARRGIAIRSKTDASNICVQKKEVYFGLNP